MERFDVIVVGGGAAGSAAALAAATRRRVAVIDQSDFLQPVHLEQTMIAEFAHAIRSGANFTVACKSAQASMRAQQHNQPRKRSLQGAGVVVISGTAELVGLQRVGVAGRILEARRLVLALGSHPTAVELPGAAQLPSISSLFGLAEPPKRLICLGINPQLEVLVGALAQHGTRITIIAPNALPTLTPLARVVIAQVSSLEQLQKSWRVNVLTAGRPTSLTAELILTTPIRQPRLDVDLQAAKVKATAAGIMVNTRFQTSNHHIYAVGSCLMSGQTDLDSLAQGTLVGRRLARSLLSN